MVKIMVQPQELEGIRFDGTFGSWQKVKEFLKTKTDYEVIESQLLDKEGEIQEIAFACLKPSPILGENGLPTGEVRQYRLSINCLVLGFAGQPVVLTPFFQNVMKLQVIGEPNKPFEIVNPDDFVWKDTFDDDKVN